jgi:hypothetical protein
MRSDGRRRTRVIVGLAVPLGLIVGGALQDIARIVLPYSATKVFFTSGLTWTSGPMRHLNFIIGSLGLGPFAIDISLIGVVGAVATVRILLALFE